MLKSSGFSLNEILEMTFDQVDMYEAAVFRQKQDDFRTNVITVTYGAQCNPEEVFKMLEE